MEGDVLTLEGLTSLTRVTSYSFQYNTVFLLLSYYCFGITYNWKYKYEVLGIVREGYRSDPMLNPPLFKGVYPKTLSTFTSFLGKENIRTLMYFLKTHGSRFVSFKKNNRFIDVRNYKLSE